MKKQMFLFGILATMLCASSLIVGCNRQKADDKGTPPKVSNTAQKDEPKPRILETVDVTPAKAITPADRTKISEIGLKLLGHVSKAKEDIQAKKVDDAKKELTQAGTLLAILKEVLPTVKVVDHIWDTKTKLSYLDTKEIPQDLVTVSASIDQLYDVLPEGKAKEHAKKAKEALTKEKEKGAAKAKEELELVEEALNFREVDLSVSYTFRLVKAAQADLEKGKTKEASDALTSVADGVMVFDTAVIDEPVEIAVRDIWLAKQDYAGKDHKAAKTRLEKAKTALEKVVHSTDKALQESAKNLLSKIAAVDWAIVDRTEAALETLWQDARKLVEHPKNQKK